MGEKEELRKEITEIMGHVKRLIIAHKDSGFEGPDITRVISDLFQKDPLAAVSIDELRILIKDCTRCELHKNRNHVVFGEGAPDARIMFIGEGPGREEDIEGRPFVGEAGRLLTKIIENGIGVKRSQVYISNVVKCRPPRNRDPQPQEIKTCLPFLEKQIRLIRPQVICTLGRIAFRALIKKDGPMQDHRGLLCVIM